MFPMPMYIYLPSTFAFLEYVFNTWLFILFINVIEKIIGFQIYIIIRN